MKKREKNRKRPMKVLKKKREREREEEIVVMLSKRFKERERPHKRSFHSIHHNPYTCTS
jgi:hypothetical protein